MSGAERREHPIEAISAFIDGELRGSERATVEAHLAGCGSCRRLAEDLRRIALAVPDATRVELPANLEARIKGRLRGESKAPRRFVLPTAIAATVGALALLGSFMFRQSKPLGEPAPSSVASPGVTLDGSAVDEVAAGKKRSEEGANRVSEKSNPAAASGERKAEVFHDQEALQKADARNSAAKDRMNEPAAPLPPGAAPQPTPRDEQPASPSAERAERYNADQRFAPPPPPPPPPPPASAESARELQLERARRASPDDARQAKEKSSAVAESDVGSPPRGVVEGVAGGVGAARADMAPPCPSPWRASVEVSWDTSRSGDPQSVLATVARDHAGQVISGRDERGPFVSLLLPEAAWPGIIENLRVLGAVVPSSPAPSLPPGTLCVRLDVRVSESLTR